MSDYKAIHGFVSEPVVGLPVVAGNCCHRFSVLHCNYIRLNLLYWAFTTVFMPRTTPTKQQLNQAIRADIPGGDCLLGLLNSLHIVRRYDLTDECRNFLDFMYNRLKSIRARMREAVIAKTDPTAACKAIAVEVKKICVIV